MMKMTIARMAEYVFNGSMTTSKEEWLATFEETRRQATDGDLGTVAFWIDVPSEHHHQLATRETNAGVLVGWLDEPDHDPEYCLVLHEDIPRLQEILLRDPDYELSVADMMEIAFSSLAGDGFESWRAGFRESQKECEDNPPWAGEGDPLTLVQCLTNRYWQVWVVDLHERSLIWTVLADSMFGDFALYVAKVDVDRLRRSFPRDLAVATWRGDREAVPLPDLSSPAVRSSQVEAV